MRIVTALYYDERMTDTQLAEFGQKTLYVRLRKQLKRAGFKHPVVGCLDMDYHPEINAWLPHFHLLVLGENPPIKELRKRFFKTPKPIKGCTLTKYRPLVSKKLKEEGPGLSYLCKSYWSLREVYWYNNKRRTRKLRLKTDQFLLSLRILDEIGFEGLLFLYGVKRTSKGLVLIKHKSSVIKK